MPAAPFPDPGLRARGCAAASDALQCACPARPGKVGERGHPSVRGPNGAGEAGMERNDGTGECRDPDAVRYPGNLPAGDAGPRPPAIRPRDGGYTAYWRDGDRVRRRGTTTDGPPAFGRSPSAPGAGSDAFPADAEARLASLTPKLPKAAARPGADMDGIERALRDSCPGSGAAGLKALPEHVDMGLEAPECESCGGKMARHRRTAKKFTTRLGDIEVVRTYFHCRDCGGGFRRLDRMIGAGGDSRTAGATGVIAGTAAAISFAPAAGTLRNLAGVSVPESAFQRRAKAIGELAERSGREVVEGEAQAVGRCCPAIDGTGVPMRREETEGVRGRREDGTARTREAKVVVAYTAGDRHPGTGEPRKDRGGETVSAAIDSAAAVGGPSARSDFAARLERPVNGTGMRDAGETVALSDGAPWIRNVRRELLSGQRVTFVLDPWHALDCAGAAPPALVPDAAERKRRIGEIRNDLKAGRVRDVIARLEPYRGRDPDVASRIDCYRKNRDRMRYDGYIRRGIQIGSGVVESLGRQIVGKRLKQPGSHWTKTGANRMPAIKSCPRNNRWADFLDWKANLTVAA